MSVLYTGLMSSAYQRHMALALVSKVVLIVRSLADSHNNMCAFRYTHAYPFSCVTTVSLALCGSAGFYIERKSLVEFDRVSPGLAKPATCTPSSIPPSKKSGM